MDVPLGRYRQLDHHTSRWALDRYWLTDPSIDGRNRGARVCGLGLVRRGNCTSRVGALDRVFIAMGARGVAFNTTNSKVPLPEQRARFQSAQSAVQHAAAALAAFASSKILSERPDGGLAHMDRIAYLSIGLSLLVPTIMLLVERELRRSRQAPPLEAGATTTV